MCSAVDKMLLNNNAYTWCLPYCPSLLSAFRTCRCFLGTIPECMNNTTRLNIGIARTVYFPTHIVYITKKKVLTWFSRGVFTGMTNVRHPKM